MKKLVAIGGGEIGRAGYSVETTQIDKEIIRLTGKKNPRLLFIPTASSDSEGYVDDIQKHFGQRLGCNVDVLFLISNKLSKKEIRQKILSSDIIYVGGGNTLQMMRIWRKLGIDEILNQAYERGIVLAGVSAGGICWFESGHSDCMKMYHPEKWGYIKVKSLAFVKGIFCPHADAQRREHFKRFIAKTGGIGIAMENSCAIEIIDNKYYKILVSKPDAQAYKFYKNRKEIVCQAIGKTAKLQPIKNLYAKQ